MTIANDERLAMCDLLERVGPNAPTLCGSWTTRDLLAHLLVRERRPDAAGGIFIPLLATYTEHVTAALADEPFTALLAQLRSGPPIWSPFALPILGDKANVGEFFVHHEDIRRAQPGWKPRSPHTARSDALWRLLQLMGRVLYRHSPVGVVLRSPAREDIIARRGAPGVVVIGSPDEIVLHAYGRAERHVETQGERDDLEAFDQSSRGL
jgi:uncharacterized protein (TIGR03085 family)